MTIQKLPLVTIRFIATVYAIYFLSNANLYAHGEKGNISGSSGGGASNTVDFPSQNIEVLSHLSLADMGGDGNFVRGNDIWGWTDSETGKEYVLMGRSDGVAFVDISDPLNPVYIGILPKVAGSESTGWRDFKVYENKAYIIADGAINGLQIFDLTQLRNPGSIPITFSETYLFQGIKLAHNIAINEDTGYAYLTGGDIGPTVRRDVGLSIVDLKVSPTSPGFWLGESTLDGYTHDAQVVTYNGPDTRYQQSEIAFCSNEDTLSIIDVTDKASTTLLSSTSYNNAAYVHQGWLTEDHKYFLSNDEIDEIQNSEIRKTRTHLWNVQNLESPIYMGYHEYDTESIDHNLYISNGLVYASNYTSGLRILSLENIASGTLEEVAWIDTHPSEDAFEFNGAWSVYPFFESGAVVISDINEGLIVVRLNIPEPAESLEEWRAKHFSESDLANSSLENTVWGLDADPDNDGLTNLQEYAYDSDPFAKVPQDEPQAKILQLPDPDDDNTLKEFMTYTWVRRKSSDVVNYQILSSSVPNIFNWMTDSFTQTSIEPGNNEFTERVTFRSLEPIDSSLFVRLKVEQSSD